jgi:hypothetical protein
MMAERYAPVAGFCGQRIAHERQVAWILKVAIFRQLARERGVDAQKAHGLAVVEPIEQAGIAAGVAGLDLGLKAHIEKQIVGELSAVVAVFGVTGIVIAD